MSYVLFILYIPIYFVFKILAYVLSPILAGISVIFNFNKYPFPINLLHTIDDDLDGGQHQLHWETNVSKFKLWLQRMYWIVRNPSAGFDSIAIGLKQSETTINVLYDIKPNGRTTKRKAILIHNGIRYFEIKNSIVWNENHYTYWWFGWNSSPHGGYCKYKLEFHPYKKINEFA